MKYDKLIFIFILLPLLLLSSCNSEKQSEKNDIKKETLSKVIIFGDPGWESARIHNSIAQYITKYGYNYKSSIYSGSSPILKKALSDGSINILMEYWVHNSVEYKNDLYDKEYEELSINYDDNRQGFYVPTYMISGDSSRGISPITPNLKKLSDLPKYAHLFKLEGQDIPNIYGPVEGWDGQDILYKKFKGYNIADSFNIVLSKSGSALTSSAEESYKKGLPWIGYYWEPTPLLGTYAFTLLEEEPYSEKIFLDTALCHFPQEKIAIVSDPNFKSYAPEIYDFLKKYKTSSEITSHLLAIQKSKSSNSEEIAKIFLRENENLWKTWVTKDAYEKIKNTL